MQVKVSPHLWELLQKMENINFLSKLKLALSMLSINLT